MSRFQISVLTIFSFCPINLYYSKANHNNESSFVFNRKKDGHCKRMMILMNCPILEEKRKVNRLYPKFIIRLHTS